MSDMSAVIIPKSDQLNADDLIVGPRTITITGVSIRGGQEQPISIHFEGDEGKPYKACKSMCRVMVTAWGPDSKQYTGRSMTLYRDPTVKWAGMEVGGIRISHMSDIESKITMALTMTKSNRKPYTVLPLAKNAPPPAQEDEPVVTADQVRELLVLMESKGIKVQAFLEFGGLENVEELAASQFELAKKWIAKQKGNA